MYQKKTLLLFFGLLSLVVALMVALRLGTPLRGQVFGGAGLVSGLNSAASELSGSGIRTDPDFATVIVDVINFALPWTAIAAFTAFVISGFIFILGFGSDTAIQRARKIMIWSGIGIVVVIFSFVLTQFVIDFAGAP